MFIKSIAIVMLFASVGMALDGLITEYLSSN